MLSKKTMSKQNNRTNYYIFHSKANRNATSTLYVGTRTCIRLHKVYIYRYGCVHVCACASACACACASLALSLSLCVCVCVCARLLPSSRKRRALATLHGPAPKKSTQVPRCMEVQEPKDVSPLEPEGQQSRCVK